MERENNLSLPVDSNPSPATPPSVSSSSKKIWQLAGIGGVVVLLVVVMYPGILTSPGVSSQASQEPAATPLNAQQQQVCSSASDDISTIIPQGENHDAAADLLDGFYCSNGEIVDSIGSTSYPATGIAAYACEATSGGLKDQAASDALQQYGPIYCTAANQSLNSEIAGLQNAANAIGADPKYSQTVKEVSSDITQAQTLLSQSKPYSAYQEFNTASQAIANLHA